MIEDILEGNDPWDDPIPEDDDFLKGFDNWIDRDWEPDEKEDPISVLRGNSRHDSCAWYSPIHYNGNNNWGIFIKTCCLRSMSRKILWNLPRPSKMAAYLDPGLFRKQCLRAAYWIIYQHELYHHKVECFGIRLNVVGKPNYKKYFEEVYDKQIVKALDYSGEKTAPLEEALANAYSYRQLCAKPFKNSVLRVVRDAAKKYLYKVIPHQPYGYRYAKDIIDGQLFEEKQYELQSIILEMWPEPVMNHWDFEFAKGMMEPIRTEKFDVRKRIFEVKDSTGLPVLPFTSKAICVRPLDLEDMLWCTPGTFMMGSPAGEKDRWGHEIQYEVTLTQGFYLGKYQVTHEQWEKVMGSNPSHILGATFPVETVSWKDAMEFCKKLTQMEKAAGRLPKGHVYTLPTEAQWEYACRAGTTTAYAFGDNITEEQANCGLNVGKTTPVGTYPPNAWGFHDMHGNVWEWCRDCYGDYPDGSASDPVGPSDGSVRVHRGGSWSLSGRSVRSANRGRSTPDLRNYTLGFRLSLQTETEKTE